MLLKHYTEVPAETAAEGPGIAIRWLISRPEGATNFAMRLFELEPGASSPHHHHPEEHEVYVLDGQGDLQTDAGPRPFRAGDFMFIAPDEMHQLTNTGAGVLRFICLIPLT